MTRKLMHSLLAVAMSFALVCPQAVQAAQTKVMTVNGVQVSTSVKDLTLQSGAIKGALVDPNGKPVKGMVAVIAQRGKTLSVQTSNAEGQYEFANLQPGVYQVATHAGIQTYRVWNAGNAPAGADLGIIQVVNEDVVRGACGCTEPSCDGGCDACDGPGGAAGGFLSKCLANPNVVLLGAVAVAAAIAIPLALDDDDAS